MFVVDFVFLLLMRRIFGTPDMTTAQLGAIAIGFAVGMAYFFNAVEKLAKK
jgi:hypothetical protein